MYGISALNQTVQTQNSFADRQTAGRRVATSSLLPSLTVDRNTNTSTSTPQPTVDDEHVHVRQANGSCYRAIAKFLHWWQTSQLNVI